MSDDNGLDYWRGFAAAVDAIQFGINHGSHPKIALRRAELFANEQHYWVRYGWKRGMPIELLMKRIGEAG